MVLAMKSGSFFMKNNSLTLFSSDSSDSSDSSNTVASIGKPSTLLDPSTLSGENEQACPTLEGELKYLSTWAGGILSKI